MNKSSNLIIFALHLGISADDTTSDKVVNLMTEIRAFQEILGKLKSLQVDPTEYACLKGIVLFKTGKYR